MSTIPKSSEKKYIFFSKIQRFEGAKTPKTNENSMMGKHWKTDDDVMHPDIEKWSFWQNSESWASEEISKLVKFSWGFLRFCVIFSAFFCEMWRKMDEGKMVENRWWRHPSGHQKMKFLTLFKMLSTSRGVKSRNFCWFWFQFSTTFFFCSFAPN